MVADMYLKVDATKEEKSDVSKAITTLSNLLEAFRRVGYIGTEEREKNLAETIETLQMILKGDVF